jgi:elongation factor G
VEPQSETVWRQADRYSVPRICFVNKMDRVGASYERSVESIRDRLGANAIEVQMPIGAEAAFRGVVDLIAERAILWTDETGSTPEEGEVPPDLRAEAAERRARMVEQIVETDDDLTLRYLNGESVSTEELRNSLRAAVIGGKATPVFCGSSLRNKGVSFCSTPSWTISLHRPIFRRCAA